MSTHARLLTDGQPSFSASRAPTESELNLYPSFRERPHTMPEQLRRQAGIRGERVAMTASDGTMTFADWLARSRGVASGLRERGAEAGETVGLWGTNAQGCEWAVSLLAIQSIGAIPIPLSSGSPLAASAEKLERLGARYVLAGEGAGDAPGDLTVVPFGHGADPFASGSPETAAVSPPLPAAVFHTSGTTGLPKATLLSHEAIAYAAAATEEYILSEPCGVAPFGPDDVIQTSVPLYTASGLLHFIAMALWSGCNLVCEERFDPKATIEAAREHGSTIWLTVPAMMTLTTDAYRDPPGATFRIVWHMGSVASADCITASRATFPDAAILNLYSLTETVAGFVVSHARDAVERPGATGRPTPNARIRVVDAAGAPVAAGEPGEVHFDSPCMFDGYVGPRELTERSFTADGWFRSGDRATVDADGMLSVLGRLGDVILRGGMNINPLPVENAMMSFPGVRDAVLAAVPHRVLGNDVVGLVVAADPDLERLRDHLLARLPRNEVPRQIYVVDAVPRNSFGKLDRRLARDLATELSQPAGSP